MNDPGLSDVIEKSGDNVHNARSENRKPQLQPKAIRKRRHIEHKQDKNEADASIYQPTQWWFASTAFPLFAGTFGPIANLFSVCALVQTWRVGIFDGSRVKDPPWLTALNACSLFLALVANIVLLLNFAHRIPYAIAQPITITFWYLACILLLIPICLEHDPQVDPTSFLVAHSQSYYYALIACVLYASVSTLLLVSTMGATVFHAYKPSFSTLTGPQRTLMLQTISFTLYLALGAGVFSSIEGWGYSDGVYWADYTLLTIGLGTDFPLTTTLARFLLIPYAAFGITLIGLVVSSVRGLVLERAKAKVVRRHLGKEREKWKENIKERRRLLAVQEMAVATHDSQMPLSDTGQKWRERRKEKHLMRLPNRLAKTIPEPLQKHEKQGAWHRAEFELMRYLEQNAETTERYAALSMSFFVILIVWSGGALIFWSCEHKSQSWTFPQSFYFTYTTLLTIGYGDFYPNSAAGKPFFVVWSLISVPAMTVLISNMGDTVVKLVQDVTVWASRWTILPEKEPDHVKAKKRTKRGRHSRKGSKRSDTPLSTASSSDKRHHSGPPDEGEQQPSDDGIPPPTTFERDIEYLGERVEEFEEDEGRPGSLAARIAREISVLAKDLRAKPPKKYSWEEWSRWLEMLGQRETGDTSGQRGPVQESVASQAETGQQQELISEHEPEPEPNPTHIPAPDILNSASINQQLEVAIPSRSGHDTPRASSSSHDNNPHADITAHDRASEDVDWHWTWLGDQGPLFSQSTETEWIIEKLCFRLEEVLEDEIREVRASADKLAKEKVEVTR